MMSQENKSAIAALPDLSQIFNDIAVSSPTLADDVAYVMALEAKIQVNSSKSEPIEIDSCSDGIYRVWKGMKVIGLVKRCPCSNNWIAEPAGEYHPRRYPSSELATAAVVKAWEAA